MSRAEKLVLVDGSWLIFRAFFAIPANLSTKEGLPTNAIYGFALMFRKLFAGRAPDRGVVVFDGPETTHREKAFPQYKAQRPPMASELRQQLPYIDELIATHRFPTLRVPGYEADDIVATLARQGAEAGMDVVIVAGDKDLAQMVGPRVRMQDTMRDVTYDAELVRKKWGVPPERIPDLLAIMGDSADNIPGVPGIGQKGAAALLEKYGDLEGILAHLGELKGKQKASLEAERENAVFYKKLATVDAYAKLDVGVDDLRLGTPDPAELDAMHKKLEFFSLLGAGAEAKVGDAPDITVEVPASIEEARALLEAWPLQPTAIVPLHSPIARLHHARMVGVALATDGRAPVYLAFEGEGALGGDAVSLLRDLYADEAIPKVLHDMKAMAILCSHHGLSFGAPDGEEGMLDVMLAAFLIDPERGIPHRLDQVAKEHAQRSVPSLKSILGSGQTEKKPEEVEVRAAATYCGQLAEVLLVLRAPLLHELRERDQMANYHAVELPLSHTLARMELAGIHVDREDLLAMSEEFTARKETIEQRIYVLANREFNIGSTKQLADVLFEELKLPVIKKTKTGYSTDAEVLQRLAPKHEIAQAVLDQRELAKLINTYTTVLRDAVAPETGRIHATFMQTTGVSGRIISTDPDLQRTPVRTPEGKRIRRAFVAPPGMKILSADWSQIELRVLAHFSQEPRLMEAFANRIDLHKRTAGILFSIDPEAVTPEQRNVGKTVNFATIYGQGATALGQILGIPRKDAVHYIEQYFAYYAGVRRWLDRTIADAHVNGYVLTLLGRRRYIPLLASRNDTDRSAGERMAANTPIQGSAADLCKLAMLSIDRALPTTAPGARMLLQVHDELVFECPEGQVDALTKLVTEKMEHPCQLTVPLVVTVGVGGSWGEAH